MLIARLAFRNSYRKNLQRLLKQKKYYDILQVDNPMATKQTLKNNYYRLIKKYHTDNVHDDMKKSKEYQQITKIIVQAYKVLEERNADKEYVYTIQDQLSMKLYSKRFDQVKYWLYRPQNQKQRLRFYKILRQEYGHKEEETQKNSNSNNNSNNNFHSKTGGSSAAPSSQMSTQKMMIIIGGSLVIISATYLLSSKEKYSPTQEPQNKIPEVTQQQINKIRQTSEQKRLQKRQKFLKELQKDLPPVLQYPKREDPHILDQVTDFSIAQDVHLYEVPSSYLQNQQKTLKQGINRKQINELTKIKPNSVLTLSLEAQRMFQNVYIRAKDIIQEIEKKGKFEPPSILFRFHGFILAQIRQKPISLKNYRDTEYISLFDLYFDYYCPIFFKRDKFLQYLVGMDDEKYFGWVHMNHRKTIPYYLKKKEKLVIMNYENSPVTQMYKKIWDNYYEINGLHWRNKYKSTQQY